MRENLARVLRLLLVTDDALVPPGDLPRVAREAVAGGVTAVQVRYKSLGDQALLDLTRTLVRELPVPVFVNDRVDVALAAGAAGVHLGADDLSPALARRIVPEGFVVGASVGSPVEVPRGRAADYWGIGPLRVTGTKADAGVALGVEGAAALLTLAEGRAAVAIGGVRPGDVAGVLAAGFSGVAVASGILGADAPRAAAERYRTAT